MFERSLLIDFTPKNIHHHINYTTERTFKWINDGTDDKIDKAKSWNWIKSWKLVVFQDLLKFLRDNYEVRCILNFVISPKSGRIFDELTMTVGNESGVISIPVKRLIILIENQRT